MDNLSDGENSKKRHRFDDDSGGNYGSGGGGGEDDDDNMENEHQTSKSRGTVTVQIFIKSKFAVADGS